MSDADDSAYQELERWRKRIEESNKEKDRIRGVREIQSLKDSLKLFIKKSGLKQARKNTDIIQLWGEIVGPEITEYTEVDSFRNGILSVYVYNSAMKQELESFYAASILESIRAACPETRITSLRFVLGFKESEKK